MSTPISTCDMNRRWVKTCGQGHQEKRYVSQAEGMGVGVENTGKAMLERELGGALQAHRAKVHHMRGQCPQFPSQLLRVCRPRGPAYTSCPSA